MRIEYEENLKGPNGEDKPGVNRLSYEVINGAEVLVNKEYLPNGKPASAALIAFMQATPDEKNEIAQELKKYL